jgi:hypothetical protein
MGVIRTFIKRILVRDMKRFSASVQAVNYYHENWGRNAPILEKTVQKAPKVLPFAS